ncbi:MAG: hypothetical protein RJA36_3241, partial [Pseudomonadota bacterium]
MMMRHGIASLADADDVEVDWDNPLTRGLTHLYIRPGVDLTSGERTAGSAPANAATRWGRALQASRSLLPYADSAANTIIGHLRMTAYDNFVGLGIGYYVSDSDMFAFQIGNWNDGELKTIIRSSGSPTGFYTLTTPSFPYDVVVALAGTIGNGNTQTPYINGVAQTGQAFTGSYFADSRKNFSLGSGANYSSSFGMRFARVLAAHEI